MSSRVMVHMVRGPASKNVPVEKLQEYLDAGWIEVERHEMTGEAPPVVVLPTISVPPVITKVTSKKAAK
jgi:hypothetical protein